MSNNEKALILIGLGFTLVSHGLSRDYRYNKLSDTLMICGVGVLACTSFIK